MSYIPLSLGASTNGLSLNTNSQKLQLQLATTSLTGSLSSTDWNTFNGKQSALSGTGLVKSTSGVISYTNGSSSQFVKGDGSLDSTSYITNSLTTLGDILYGGASGASTRLAGDTSNTRKFLRTLSSSSVATAPAWDTLTSGDINSAFTITTGSILFWNSGISQNNNNLYWNTSISLPTTGGLSVGVNGDFNGSDAINIYYMIDSYLPNSINTAGGSTTTGMSVSTSRGTGPSPSESTDNDYIGTYSGWAYNGSIYSPLTEMRSYVSGATTNNRGGRLEWWTKQNNGSLTKGLVLTNTQTLQLSTYTTVGMLVNDSSGNVSTAGLVGSGERFITANASGIIQTAYTATPLIITDSSTITLITTETNWSTANVYTGTALTVTFMGQVYNNANWLYYMVDDVTPVRMSRNSLMHLIGNSSTPGIAGGTGAGTSPTVAVVGNDMNHRVTITTGTSPTAAATVATITFNRPYASAAPRVIFSPANTNATALAVTAQVSMNGASTTTYTIVAGSAALTATTQYIWNVITGE